MEADDLKAWRTENKMTQEQAAEKLHLTRAQLANYEAGRRPIPDEVKARATGKVRDLPAPKPKAIAKSSAAEIAEQAKAELKAMEPRPADVPKNARRPTKKEIRDFPNRFSGPDVWVVEYDPPEKLSGGREVRFMILKRTASGQGDTSMHLVGKCSRRKDVDKEALAPGVYHPFTPCTGIPLEPRGPNGGKRKAA